MKRHTISMLRVVLTAASLFPLIALAQDPAPDLQDLVGVRGRDGERELEDRGYTFVKMDKSGSSAYLYWRAPRTGQCVTVHVEEGRYQSLVTTAAIDCQGEASPATGNHASGKHSAVCGVTTPEGKTYRYDCTVTGAPPGGPGRTTLRYPDQTIVLHWRKGDRVDVTFEGMKEQSTTYSSSEGSTEFDFEGKTYFYMSNR